MKTLSLKLKKRLNEAYIVPPNDMGFNLLNKIYKSMVVYFKTAPFIIIVPLSLILGIFMYLVFGYLLVRLVSLLQYGF